ncbi:hypothetical protein TSA6c_06505 [Azospirillum sp. TSA6c]|nr:hypothetical protein TSA6c_06505 [Azospirillum sp. TSA6c]
MVLLAALAPAMAQDASTAPFLRIETGRHTARINRLATDASGRLVATVSSDKTVRLWARDSGEEIGTIRVPIEDGEEGALYAVALSADGKLAVASGHTGSTWGDGIVLYLFDVEKQQLKARLPGQPQVVNHLAMSPDGRFIAGVFGAGAGLRVWDAATFKLVAEHGGYGARATWVDFDRAGRLATVAADGTVRLYDPAFKPIATRKAAGDDGAYSLAFSPDGRRLAVGYSDKLRVDVLRASDLKPIATPATSGLTSGSLAAVAWVTGNAGLSLVAAGTAKAGGADHVLRRWSDAGGGAFSDTPISRDSVNQLLAGTDGSLLFASADPAWGLVGREGRLVHRIEGEIGDFRNIVAGRFGVSADGLVLDFGMDADGRTPMRFDVLNRSLTADPPADPAMTGPIAESPIARVTDWRNTQTPRLNGVPLPLDAGEWSRSMSFTPDGKGLLLGGEFGLRLFDVASGRELHRVGTPGAAWGVAVSGNGRLAVAALGDGTIRWYSLDGSRLEEQAALFPRRRNGQWVLWTPEAFFDHSEGGGQSMVGIHLNDGKRKSPLWIDFGQIYRMLHAPELVRGKLEGTAAEAIGTRRAAIGDLRRLTLRRPQIQLTDYCAVAETSRAFGRDGTAVQPSAEDCRPIESSALARAFRVSGTAAEADDGGSPRTAIALPAGTSRVRLRFRVVDTGSGIGTIHVFRNDRNVSAEGAVRGFGRVTDEAGEMRERTVLLEPGANRVRLWAYDRNDAVYEQSGVVDFTVPTPPQRVAARSGEGEAPSKPRLLLLTAGINEYRAPGARLAFARPDAQAFAREIREHIPSHYDAASSLASWRELYDAAATRSALVEALEAIGRDSREDDTVVLYLAGHGIVVPFAQEPGATFYHFVTQDVPSLEAVTDQALSEKDLVRLISGIHARNVLLLLDTCHAGAFSEGNVDKFYRELGKSRYVLAASASGQEALDGYDGRHGVFARAVLDGLAGKARFQDDTVVYHLTLGDYVRRRVPRLAQEKNWKQNAFFKTGGNELSGFPLVASEGEAAR